MLSKSQYIKLIVLVPLIALLLLLLPQFRTPNGYSAIGMLIFGIIGAVVTKDFSARWPRFGRIVNWAFRSLLVLSFVGVGGAITIIAETSSGKTSPGTAILALAPIVLLFGLAIFWLYWGMFLATRGNYDAAIKHYSLLARINSNSAHPYSNRAVMYAVKGDLDSALSDYQRAIDLATHSSQQPKGGVTINYDIANLYAGRSAVWFLKKDYAAAIADSTRGLEIESTAPLTRFELLYNRGLAYLELSRYAEASADFDAVPFAALKPKEQALRQPHLLAQRAFATRGLGQTEKALILWREALALEPKFADVNWLTEKLKWSEAKIEAAQALNVLV